MLGAAGDENPAVAITPATRPATAPRIMALGVDVGVVRAWMWRDPRILPRRSGSHITSTQAMRPGISGRDLRLGGNARSESTSTTPPSNRARRSSVGVRNPQCAATRPGCCRARRPRCFQSRRRKRCWRAATGWRSPLNSELSSKSSGLILVKPERDAERARCARKGPFDLLGSLVNGVLPAATPSPRGRPSAGHPPGRNAYIVQMCRCPALAIAGGRAADALDMRRARPTSPAGTGALDAGCRSQAPKYCARPLADAEHA